METPYEDIIGLPHHVSTSHPRMSRHDRAAQFAPFSALVGYRECLEEESRQTVTRQELDGWRQAEIDGRLRHLVRVQARHPEVSVTFFVPDERKSGGRYDLLSGCVREVDVERGTLVLEEQAVPLEDIVSLEGEVFDVLEG